MSHYTWHTPGNRDVDLVASSVHDMLPSCMYAVAMGSSVHIADQAMQGHHCLQTKNIFSCLESTLVDERDRLFLHTPLQVAPCIDNRLILYCVDFSGCMTRALLLPLEGLTLARSACPGWKRCRICSCESLRFLLYTSCLRR